MEKLRQLEEGEKEASRPLLARMAAVYRRPLLSFYLPTPPAKADRGEDFRTLPEEKRIENKGAIDALVRDVFVRQELVKSALIDIEDAYSRTVVGIAQADWGAEKFANILSNIIGFDLREYRGYRKQEDAFSYLRDLVEQQGVFVLLIGNLGSHHTNIPVEVFRGFALADPVAPFIVINDLDSHSARSFTLLHELAHIAMGQTGVSGSMSELKIEKFCNEVAALILLGDDDLSEVDWARLTIEQLVKKASGYAQPRNVSGSLIVYRLLLQGLITEDQWTQASERLRALWLLHRKAEKEEKAESSGPSYYVVKRYKLGGALIDVVNRTMRDGALTATKAGRVLGVKPANVYNLIGV
ncbi:ImmA/IrrE family metallo-endopeptidase [Pseudomonas aeruginosa]|uniref:ImmA/IrrE family metallo-endopeptidase n=1 Tax=Pseudomonas aeruginosa TaxID=287 RepID=UPI0032E4E655